MVISHEVMLKHINGHLRCSNNNIRDNNIKDQLRHTTKHIASKKKNKERENRSFSCYRICEFVNFSPSMRNQKIPHFCIVSCYSKMVNFQTKYFHVLNFSFNLDVEKTCDDCAVWCKISVYIQVIMVKSKLLAHLARLK